MTQQMALNILKALMNGESLQTTKNDGIDKISLDLLETLSEYFLPHMGVDFQLQGSIFKLYGKNDIRYYDFYK